MIKRGMLCISLNAFIRPAMIGRPSNKLIVFIQQQHLLDTHCGAVTILGTGYKVWKSKVLLCHGVPISGSLLTYWEYKVSKLPD